MTFWKEEGAGRQRQRHVDSSGGARAPDGAVFTDYARGCSQGQRVAAPASLRHMCPVNGREELAR